MKKFSIVYINDNQDIFHTVVEGDSIDCIKNYLISIGSSKQYSNSTFILLIQEFKTLKELCRYMRDINEYLDVIEIL
jgi:hypothetical protein